MNAAIVPSWQPLLSQFETPFYHYELEKVRLRVEELSDQLPEGAQIYYSLKCNPLPSVVQEAVDSGCALEVTSLNELSVACQTRVPRQKILYSGPGKTEAELKDALACGVSSFSLESWQDFGRLNRLAEGSKQLVNVLFRINPSQALTSGLAMSGAKTQFGFEELEFIRGWSATGSAAQEIVLTGFHVYYGTQMKNEDVIAEAAEAAIACAERLSESTGFVPKVLNLGGGFPWAYAQPQVGTELQQLKPKLDAVLGQRKCTANAVLWFESGRYVSASSGTLVCRVLDIKASKDDSTFVVLDAGINTLGGMSGLGRIPRGYTFLSSTATPLLRVESEASEKDVQNEKTAIVVGPLCTPLDCMSRKFSLPEGLAVGDVISVPNVGAYGLTASLVAFLTRPTALEIATRNGKVETVHQLRHGHQLLSLEENIND